MKTIVRNLLTNEESVYVNDQSLIENMINAIILKEKATSNLLNKKFREKIKNENNLKLHTSKITGQCFVFCEKHNLIAKIAD